MMMVELTGKQQSLVGWLVRWAMIGLLTMVAGLLLAACNQQGPPSPDSSPTSTAVSPDDEANFVLHVLNTSELDSIDIKIYIDGDLEIEADLVNADATMLSIPLHKTYAFHLDKGRHTIKAVSVAGNAVLEEGFTVIDKHWAILGYEYWSGVGPETPPEHFQFVFQDEPIYFQ